MLGSPSCVIANSRDENGEQKESNDVTVCPSFFDFFLTGCALKRSFVQGESEDGELHQSRVTVPHLMLRMYALRLNSQ